MYVVALTLKRAERTRGQGGAVAAATLCAILCALLCFGAPRTADAGQGVRPQLGTPGKTLERGMQPRSYVNSMVVTGNRVNLRAAPSRNARVIRQMNKGFRVNVLDSSLESDGVWYYVRTGSGNTGWVFGDYVGNTWVPDGDRMQITGNRVNVRSRPNRKAKVITQLNSGHPVWVTDWTTQSDGAWCYVTTSNGTSGWVFGQYVDY